MQGAAGESRSDVLPARDSRCDVLPARDVRHGVFRVVVADDAVGIRELMRTLLSLEPDFELVGQASDGAEAVELVTQLRPDLVVIDVSMPVMDGLQAIAQIRVVCPDSRIAVLSAEPFAPPSVGDLFIEKGTPNDVVIAALRTLCIGGLTA